MFKMQMISPDLERQILLLKEYPEILEKRFRPALYRSVNSLANRIRPSIPRRSGRAAQAFGSKVTGKGINLTGRVGWYDRTDPWYPNILEHGAQPHTITAKPGGFLRLQGGRYVRSVQHPGFSAIGFMAAGYSAMQPVITQILAEASESVVQDLALDS